MNCRYLTSATVVMIALLALAACDDLPEWMGGGSDKKPLPGTRIAVLSESSHMKPDDSLTGDVAVPDVTANDNWRQAGGSPKGMTGNLQLSGLTHHDSVTIGDGNDWDQPLYPNLIAANGVVYAMDAKGYITAHDAVKLSVRWTNKSFVTKHEPDILGGGLGFEDGKLFATSGRGQMVALDAATGKELWKTTIGVPLRAPPKAVAGKVYAISVDNQTFAFDAEHGNQLWSHRGINENAGFLAAISPAVTETVIIAPYSSGELHALDTVSGQDIWSDTLLLARRTFATAGFSGIGGNPIIKDDIVYAPGSSGFFAAISLLTGRRVWEQDISSLNTPWIADDYLYVLSVDNELVCFLRADGRVKWTKQLPRWGNEEKHKDPLVWRGPVMAGGQLLLSGPAGQMLALSPKDGSAIATVEIPEGVTDAPIVAGGRLYLLTQDAKLHVLY